MDAVRWIATLALAAGAVAAGAAGVSATPARSAAASFTVSAATDAPDAAPGDGHCGTAGGVCTLRAAVQEANALPGPDSIALPAGTYALEIPPLNENESESGDLDVTDPLTVTGPGATVDGRGIDRIIEVHDFAGAVRLEGVTLHGGLTPEHGGGIANTGAAGLTLAEVTLTGNSASKGGSAIDNAAGGAIELVGSTVRGNGGEAGGPAIGNRGVDALAGSVSIVDSTVAENVAGGEDGGGVFHGGDGTVTLTRSLVTANYSQAEGGGVAASGEGWLVVRDSVVSENVSAGSGGGVAVLEKASASFSGSSVMDNVAHVSGGGVSYESDGTLTMDNGTLTRNSATDGGGLQASGTGVGEMVLTSAGVYANRAANRGGGVLLQGGASRLENVHVLDNQAASEAGGGAPEAEGGGGIEVQTAGPVLLIDAWVARNTTAGSGGGIDDRADGAFAVLRSALTGNTAARGGAIASDGDAITAIENTTMSGNHATVAGGAVAALSGLFLRHVTVADNAAPDGSALAVIGDSKLQVGGSVVSGECWYEPGTLPLESLGGNVATSGGCGFERVESDPRLGALTDNGGATGTHALLAGSAAVDLVSTGDCPATDQRSAPRPFGPACDSGAYEFGATPPPAPPPPPPPPARGSGPWGDRSSATGSRRRGAPVLGRVRVRPNAFRTARRARASGRRRHGTTFRFWLSETARVRIVFQRRLGRMRYRRVGTISRRATRGRNALAFSGGRLRPGRYPATVRAIDADGNRSRARRVSLRILR